MTIRLRMLRQQAGMTLGTLAARAGLTESYLSKIERGQSSPSIAVAIRLADALRVDVETLFGSDRVSDLVTVVRADERVRVSGDGPDAVSPYESIATGLVGKQMLPFVVSPSDQATAAAFRTHAGEELVFVHRGRVVLEFPKYETKLASGDAAYFQGGVPHRLRRAGAAPASALIVISYREGQESRLAH